MFKGSKGKTKKNDPDKELLLELDNQELQALNPPEVPINYKTDSIAPKVLPMFSSDDETGSSVDESEVDIKQGVELRPKKIDRIAAKKHEKPPKAKNIIR